MIKKGDKFLCIKAVKMNGDGEVAYTNGRVYTSEVDGCLTDEQGDKLHEWGGENLNRYFRPFTGYTMTSTLDDFNNEEFPEPHMDWKYKRVFDSGAVRDSNEGKSRPDLISPYFTHRLGLRLMEGAKKYKERNWERGIPDAAFLESLERHLVAYKMGKTDEDHAGAIAFNIMGIIHNEETRKQQ